MNPRRLMEDAVFHPGGPHPAIAWLAAGPWLGPLPCLAKEHQSIVQVASFWIIRTFFWIRNHQSAGG